ncbi:hypothetical protein IGB42_04099 [Andreprevotia sp. IGB-42]|nr:hypothetical protein IGB42_04099 [Andreprevotia sp. IGB-42]
MQSKRRTTPLRAARAEVASRNGGGKTEAIALADKQRITDERQAGLAGLPSFILPPTVNIKQTGAAFDQTKKSGRSRLVTAQWALAMLERAPDHPAASRALSICNWLTEEYTITKRNGRNARMQNSPACGAVLIVFMDGIQAAGFFTAAGASGLPGKLPSGVRCRPSSSTPRKNEMQAMSVPYESAFRSCL